MKVTELINFVNLNAPIDYWKFDIQSLASAIGVTIALNAEPLNYGATRISMYPLQGWQTNDNKSDAYACFLDGEIMCYKFRTHNNSPTFVWASREIAEEFQKLAQEWASDPLDNILMANQVDMKAIW